MSTKRDYKSFNFILLALVLAISIFGIIILGSIAKTKISVVEVYNKQKLFFAAGLVVLLLAALIDYKFIAKFYIPIYLVNIFLLVIVFFLDSQTSAGSRTDRWIEIPGFGTLQPSEFNKIFLIICLSAYIDKCKDTINNIFVLLSVLGLAGIPTLLIIAQPSLSAGLVSAVILVSILFASKIDYKYIVGVLAIVVPIVSILFLDLLYNDCKIVNFLIDNKIFLKDYHITRIMTFINPPSPGEANFDVYRQTFYSINAIGSGGLNGMGLYGGQSKKLGFVAASQTDFIFAVISEELGFVGAFAVISLMLLIIAVCLWVSNKSNSFMGRLIACGVASMFAFQVFVNVAVATGLIPNTGMPFPFVSAGGSSMLVNMACVGLVINVGMEKSKSIFEG